MAETHFHVIRFETEYFIANSTSVESDIRSNGKRQIAASQRYELSAR
ncbi:MAG: hypothetical protein ABI356_02645 [Steroidobacteraceae bacterium]